MLLFIGVFRYELFSLLSLSILTPGLVWTVFDARAQTCVQAPSCDQLGYNKDPADCAGKAILYCPFDKTKAYCVDKITCASLGFNDIISECPGEYTICPSDSTKGKCIFEASPGDLKYSLRISDHDGWLLCDGSNYTSAQFPELYAAISGSFGDKLPSYSGYFIKAAATSSASAFRTAQEAGLPNITGTLKLSGVENNGSKSPSTGSGAFSVGSNTSGYAKGHSQAATQPTITFNASSSSPIYGRSYTVTPQNYSANVFIYAGRNKGQGTVFLCCGKLFIY